MNAAWRAQPSGPDVWADALVRRMYPASAGVEEEIEEANGSAGAYAPTLPLSHNRRLCLPLLWEIFSYFFEMIKDYSLCTNGKFVRPIK